MSNRTDILVVDDGDLADVCEVLDELDVEYQRLRGSAIPEALRPPRILLVISPGRALELARNGGTLPGPAGTLGIVVVSEDSPVLRTMLRAAGYDFLVRRPVHRSALRLLLLRAFYRGPERRRDPRLPSGCHVSFRVGVKRRACVLADISEGGCRLLTTQRVEPGTRLEVRLTREVTGCEELDLCGGVVRCEQGDCLGGVGAGYSLGVRFDALPAASRSRLRAIVRIGLVGTRLVERRESPRKEFRKKVAALCAEAERVIIGRDLSMGGMRVERHPDLRLGQKVRVALHLETEREPLVLDAVVARDDGHEGMGLEFDALPPLVERHLDRILAGLPSVEFLGGSEMTGAGGLLAELLPVGPSDR